MINATCLSSFGSALVSRMAFAMHMVFLGLGSDCGFALYFFFGVGCSDLDLELVLGFVGFFVCRFRFVAVWAPTSPSSTDMDLSKLVDARRFFRRGWGVPPSSLGKDAIGDGPVYEEG